MDEEPILIVEHTADWALRVRGGDLAELFRHAAEGLAHLLVADVAAVPLDQARDVKLDAYDTEDLLVDWLGELVYWAERDEMVFPVAELRQVTATRLAGTVRGGRVAEMQKHIKEIGRAHV